MSPPRCQTDTPGTRGSFRWLIPAGFLVAASLAGCESMARRMGYEAKRDKRGMMKFERIPPKTLEQRLASESPDERREGIVALSDPGRCSLDSVVKLLSLMARKDPDPTVRAAAARALGRSPNPAAVDPLIAATDDKNDLVREDATLALTWKSDDNAKRALLIRLAKDTDSQVRARAASGLAGYRERRVLEALVEALRDMDFTVIYHAEQSLIKLTGYTHGYDADAWNRWLAGVGAGDPFARAGQTPASMQGSGLPLSERMRRAFHRAWFWWQADPKVGN